MGRGRVEVEGALMEGLGHQEVLAWVVVVVVAARSVLVVHVFSWYPGGEAIRQINQQSGAHVELSRAPPPNPVEKVFIIRGNPQQIEHAQQLINERIGGPPPGAANGQGPPNYPTQYPQPYQQPPPPNQPYAPQGWGNAYQHWQNQSAPPNDPCE
ncbi:hypothetical protein HPB52_017548 [Rhipicephalus sanguineus]|uniref:K Homology domain-containing protein n=1 Tax=Rhipicephalus sanguineus TaxID=34632 RepID=A0A9D4Q7N3_RHISA|nr:hypothetical protein HPB52_017548 [Rhipicephalus sanguineus]